MRHLYQVLDLERRMRYYFIHYVPSVQLVSDHEPKVEITLQHEMPLI